MLIYSPGRSTKEKVSSNGIQNLKYESSATYHSKVITNIIFFFFVYKQSGKNYTTQNLLRITFSFNDLMLKTNRLKKDFFHKDRLLFGLDDPVANMSIRHVYYA